MRAPAHLLLDAGVEHRPRARLDPRVQNVRRDVQTGDQRRQARLRRPEAVAAQRVAGFGELESADDAAAVVRVHRGGRLGIPLGQECVRRLAPSSS